MSWRHGLAAGELALDDPVAKAVLNALAFHAADWSGQCWPSLDRLVMWTGLSRRSVQNGLRRLEAEGLIETRTGRSRSASVYTLKLEGVPTLSQGAARADHGAAAAPHGAGDAPQLSKNDQKKDSRSGLTPDWTPDPATLLWAKERWPDADVPLELERFINVNLSKPEEIHDVDRAFRAWILRGVQLQKDRSSRPGAVGRVPLEDGRDRLRARAARPVGRDGEGQDASK